MNVWSNEWSESQAEGRKRRLTNGNAIGATVYELSKGGGIAYHLTHQIPSGLIVSKSIDGGTTFPIRTVAATPADQTGCLASAGR